MKRETQPPTASSQTQSPVRGTEPGTSNAPSIVGRRSFLKGLGVVGATLLPARLLLMADAKAQEKTSSGKLTQGDTDLLRFAAWAEIVGSELWVQDNEMGGAPKPTGGKPC